MTESLEKLLEMGAALIAKGKSLLTEVDLTSCVSSHWQGDDTLFILKMARLR